MSKITDKRVDQYMLDILPSRSNVLLDMEEHAKRRNIPIIGPVVARILFQYARLINAERIFEMGSAIGYSTMWLAMAVGKRGKVYYSDGSESNAVEARG